MTFSQHDVNWASQECEWQNSGELSVGRYLNALDYIRQEYNNEMTASLILELGFIIEPELNTPSHFRQVAVMIGNDMPPYWADVPRLMEQLLNSELNDKWSSELWLKEFERIHPFRDGNGRVGALLYNFLNNTLDDLVFPPNLWNDSRRE